MDNRYKGFTLIELMVSVALLAIISVMTFSAIQSAFNTYEKLAVQSRAQSLFVAAMNIINDDMANLVARPVRTTQATSLEAFHLEGLEGEYIVEFTRGGIFVYQFEEEQLKVMGLASPQTDLARVAYQFVDRTLYRYEWTTLDAQERIVEAASQQVLFENVEDVQIIAYSRDQDGELQEEYQWPPAEGRNKELLLPVAISILVHLENRGEFVFFLPGLSSG